MAKTLPPQRRATDGAAQDIHEADADADREVATQTHAVTSHAAPCTMRAATYRHRGKPAEKTAAADQA